MILDHIYVREKNVQNYVCKYLAGIALQKIIDFLFLQ